MGAKRTFDEAMRSGKCQGSEIVTVRPFEAGVAIAQWAVDVTSARNQTVDGYFFARKHRS
jgi:hypothetical protein